MKTYRIQDREAGNVIETGLTFNEAEKMLQQFEDTDRNEGNYTPDFYEIKEEDDLLEKWIVVSFPYANPENAIRVTRRSNFEKMEFCKAYDNHGVQVDCSDAECYSFSNSESSIFDDFYNEISEEFNFTEDVLDRLELTHRGLYEMLIEPVDSIAYKVMQNEFDEWDAMIEFFKEWREQNENHTEVTGWTYWDSHNHKTVVSKADFGEVDCNELDEDEQIEILLQMPQTAPHIEGTNTSVETDNFIFHFDLWVTNPWYCYVERK